MLRYPNHLLLPVVFGAVVFKLLVWCGAEGYVSFCRMLRYAATFFERWKVLAKHHRFTSQKTKPL